MPLTTVLLEIDPPIAVITLDRPADGNTINERLAFEIGEAVNHLAQDNGIWAVIITGKGDAFCRGTATDALRSAINTPEALARLRVADYIARLEGPVIAAVNGDALDQGLELALACDLRIASSEAGLGLTHVKQGMIPWDGGTQRLPRLAGSSRAMEMILTSRVLEAREALEMGLLNDVVEPGRVLEQAREAASIISNHGPIAARYLKEAVLKGLDMTLSQGLRLEGDLNFILQSTADRAEGIASFLEWRKPEYEGQ